MAGWNHGTYWTGTKNRSQQRCSFKIRDWLKSTDEMIALIQTRAWNCLCSVFLLLLLLFFCLFFFGARHYHWSYLIKMSTVNFHSLQYSLPASFVPTYTITQTSIFFARFLRQTCALHTNFRLCWRAICTTCSLRALFVPKHVHDTNFRLCRRARCTSVFARFLCQNMCMTRTSGCADAREACRSG